ncbi:hypothetical protein DNU06_11250 [Putridiphycobacter roseus]|uniref:Carboxypeptidase-like regulatory domain-containing protein n=1 Tax=Putridiphycobacter roseus TaxID=2219161 RepID=A0A2W1NFM9_9FLAO|nr:hypothetical protein [Putridiphycobacter roseus]PZE16826.1 hypothetical protein DNU06_11250 [Putridiphycobacter roseus]
MRIFILFLLFYTQGLCNAQTVTVFGVINNTEGGIVKYARIAYGKGKADFTKSNVSGYYQFEIELARLYEMQVTEINHDPLLVSVDRKLLKSIQNNRLEINLVLNDIVLKEIIVKAKEPLHFFGTDAYSVADFELDAQSNFILLTYAKTMAKGSALQLLDTNQRVIDTYELSEKAIELKSDFRKNVHLISETKVFLVRVIHQKLHLFEEDKDYYFTYVSSILDTLNENIYYTNFSEKYPAFNYIQFNKKDSTYLPLLGIVDEIMMEQYLSEFKFSDVRTRLWALQKQVETGIDKEVWVGATIFTNSIYYQPLYAPLFVHKDTVLVFDHYKSKMFIYDAMGVALDSTGIDYHLHERKSGWEQPLIQDKNNQAIYVIFERDGFTYLSLLDTQTGQIIFSRRLFYKYVEKIMVVDNKVYYIYRPFESIQKKYVYVEKINR